MRQAWNPEASEEGVKDSGNWPDKVCSWCKYNGDGVGCYGIGPPTTFFTCQAGYVRVAPGNCVKPDDPVDEPPSCGCGSDQCTSHPVSILTGSKKFFYTDFSAQRSALSLFRTYSSRRSGVSAYTSALGLGSDWRYDFQIELDVSGLIWGSTGTARLNLPIGPVIDISRVSSGGFETYGGTRRPLFLGYSLRFIGTWPASGTLNANMTTWELTDPDNSVWTLETQNSNYANSAAPNYVIARPVSKISGKDGTKTTFSYDATGAVKEMSDEFGNKISFIWNYETRRSPDDINQTYLVPVSVKSATLPDGSTINYTYAATAAGAVPVPARMTKSERTATGGQVIDRQSYSFEDQRFPDYITKITDLRSVVVNVVTYDGRGRAVSSTLANGTDASTILYNDVASGSTTRTVTNALGKKTTYNFSLVLNQWRLTSVDGVASTNCPASNSAFGYDNRSFVTSQTDEEGRLTTYVRDARGRPTSITRVSP